MRRARLIRALTGGCVFLLCCAVSPSPLSAKEKEKKKKDKSAASQTGEAKPDKTKSEDDASSDTFVQKGTQVGEFAMPQFDLAGKLSGKLKGASSTYLGGSAYLVETVMFTAFTNGASDYVFNTAKCHFDKTTSEVTSEDPVSFQQTGFSLSGMGLRWNLKENRGTVMSNVTVNILNATSQLKP